MSTSTSADNEEGQSRQQQIQHHPKSRFVGLIRHYSLQVSTTMRTLKLKERCKTTQVHAFNPFDTSSSTTTAGGGSVNKAHHYQGYPTINSILSSTSVDTTSVSTLDSLLPSGLPTTDSLEPPVEFCLKSVDFVESLAELYRRVEKCLDFDKSLVYLEQYSLLYSLGDPKLLRRCLQSARQYAVDVHSKVVLSAWLRYERREDELVGTSPLDCIGRILECPRASLSHGFDPNSVLDHCQCLQAAAPNGTSSDADVSTEGTRSISEEEDGDGDVCFSIGDEEVICFRGKVAALSTPLKAMLYGDFVESESDRIDFSPIGISVEGMKAVKLFSLSGKLDSCSPHVVLEILSFANRFCCEGMKSACDSYLASFVSDIDEALVLIDYALEERAYILVASCLQVMLRELPGYLYNTKIMNVFCSFEAREKLALVGHASFLLYYFLCQVALEDNTTSKVTVMLLERLRECATEKWQEALALHLLGCVLLERKEYKDAQCCFEAAAEAGHVYSVVGVARCKYKQGQRYISYDLINSLILKYKPTGWMYQERSLYNLGNKKIADLNDATRLDPTLSFPYKYRAVAFLEENQIEVAISEINRIIGFKVSSDCLELRAWFFIAFEDYESAMRDLRALLTLEPNYMMFQGRMRGDHLVELLNQHVQQWSPADCWMQLYNRWSSVDDIGSLSVIHQMLVNDPGKSVLRFRQSLLLLR